ncbi:hypothetical protein FNL37_1421 [Methylovorus glucosotrophus]|uniref:hypothetical protein n=1 Tax=Methylovorus glucosotrophus TaxID=266009 RepID=UPI0013317B8E|nr:hypothetical protein [Methylovorus glucosotrophus]KAF0843986.1 hypothetical protein FNL37_1421 [Methylovorus glucosotrophus]
MRSLIVCSTLIFALGHQAAFAAPTNERVSVVFGKGCNIAVTLPHTRHGGIGNGGDPDSQEGGMEVNPLPASWKSNMGRMYFSLECMNKNDPNLMQPSGVLNSTTNTWGKDPDYMRSYLTTSTEAYERNKAEEIIETTQVYDIKAVNGHGWADTYVYLIGDEQYRQRSMSFCIFHDSKALCGNGKVAYVNEPQGDLTQHAIEILRTIEFLPDVPAVEPVKQ